MLSFIDFNLKNFLIKPKNLKINFINIGNCFFSISIFLLASAPFLSSILLFISSVISTIKNKNLFLKDRLNLLLLFTSLILIFSSAFNYFYPNPILNNSFSKSNFFTGLSNYLPLFWVFWTSQFYLKTSEQRKQTAILLIAGTFPVFISQLLQHNQEVWGIGYHLTALNGLIIWFLKPTPLMYGYAGLFNNANYLAAWLSIVLPFSIASIFQKYANFERFLISILFLILICASIIICFSRIGFFSIPLHLTILLTHESFLIIISILLLLPFFILLKLILINLTLPITLINFSNFQNNFLIANILNETLNSPRLTIFLDTIKFISKRPLIGWGSSTYPEVNKMIGERTNITHAHNLPLEIAYNYGIIPSILLIAIFLFIVLKSLYLELKIKKINLYLLDSKYKNSYLLFNKAWISSAIVIGIFQLVDVHYYDLRISLGMWIILGGLRSYIYEIKNLEINSIMKNS